jgi:hypothetical protein
VVSTMSLPQGWEFGWDDSAKQWFYRHKPTGIVQYELPTGSNPATGGGTHAPQPASEPTSKPTISKPAKSAPGATGDDMPRLDATGGISLSAYYDRSTMLQETVVCRVDYRDRQLVCKLMARIGYPSKGIASELFEGLRDRAGGGFVSCDGLWRPGILVRRGCTKSTTFHGRTNRSASNIQRETDTGDISQHTRGGIRAGRRWGFDRDTSGVFRRLIPSVPIVDRRR